MLAAQVAKHALLVMGERRASPQLPLVIRAQLKSRAEPLVDFAAVLLQLALDSVVVPFLGTGGEHDEDELVHACGLEGGQLFDLIAYLLTEIQRSLLDTVVLRKETTAGDQLIDLVLTARGDEAGVHLLIEL